MTIKKFFYSELRNFLQSKSIDIESTISNDSYFFGISSLELAKENDITFFHNSKYTDLLALTKAKACFVTLAGRWFKSDGDMGSQTRQTYWRSV